MKASILARLDNEKIRFLIVGSLNTILDFLFLNVLVWGLGVWSYAANAISVVICICISYSLNHYFVFRKKEKLSIKAFVYFFAVTGFSSIFLQSLIIWLSYLVFDTPFSRSILAFANLPDDQVFELNLAKCAAVGVGMVWNFLFYKHIVFKERVSRNENQFVG